MIKNPITIKILTLPETNSSHLKIGGPLQKEIPNLETTNFLGAKMLLVSGSVPSKKSNRSGVWVGGL